jgi:hypothetical protein
MLVGQTQAPAELLVIAPASVSAILFGIRGGIAGLAIGFLGVSTFYVIAGTGPFTGLLHNTNPDVIMLVIATAATASYGRLLEKKRTAASQLALSTQIQLERLETESRLLSLLSVEIVKSSAVESIALAASTTLTGLVDFDRMVLYLLDDVRGTAKLSFVTGDLPACPVKDDVFPLEVIMAADPFDSRLSEPTRSGHDTGNPADGPQLQQSLIFQQSINDSTEHIALLRLWSSRSEDLSESQNKYIRSVTAQITPALKRASLQSRNRRDARVNAVVAEFSEITHESLEVNSVVGAATALIGNYLGSRHVVMAVADLDGRQVTVRGADGETPESFGISEVRTLAEVLSDPLADYRTRVVSAEECKVIGRYSEVATGLANSGLGSFIVSNLQYDGELIVQLWIGFEKHLEILHDDSEFVTRVA